MYEITETAVFPRKAAFYFTGGRALKKCLYLCCFVCLKLLAQEKGHFQEEKMYLDSRKTVNGTLSNKKATDLGDSLFEEEDDVIEFVDTADTFIFETHQKKLRASGAVTMSFGFPYDAPLNMQNVDDRISQIPNWENLFSSGSSLDIPLSSAIQLRYHDLHTYGQIAFSMSVKSGKSDTNLRTDRAYVGFHLLGSRKDLGVRLELGRQRMSDIAFSRVQYSSAFDGVFCRIENKCKTLDSSVGFGLFAIDADKSFVGQVAVLRINHPYLGMFAEASIINWNRLYGDYSFREKVVAPLYLIQDSETGKVSLESLVAKNYSFAYCNSQVVIGLASEGIRVGKYALYLGATMNHTAQMPDKSHPYNKAAFMGIHLGQIEKKGDLELDFQIFYAEPFSIREADLAISSKVKNSLHSDRGLQRSGDPFLSASNVMGPKMSLSFARSQNLRIVLEAGCGFSVLGNYPVSTRTSIGFGYAF